MQTICVHDHILTEHQTYAEETRMSVEIKFQVEFMNMCIRNSFCAFGLIRKSLVNFFFQKKQ